VATHQHETARKRATNAKSCIDASARRWEVRRQRIHLMRETLETLPQTTIKTVDKSNNNGKMCVTNTCNHCRPLKVAPQHIKNLLDKGDLQTLDCVPPQKIIIDHAGPSQALAIPGALPTKIHFESDIRSDLTEECSSDGSSSVHKRRGCLKVLTQAQSISCKYKPHLEHSKHVDWNTAEIHIFSNILGNNPGKSSAQILRSKLLRCSHTF